MAKIRDVYEQARKELNPNISAASLRLLMVETNNFKNYADLDHNLEKEQQNEDIFWKMFASLNKGVPVQYIVNNANFLGEDFHVDSRVLIPRPETEELVEQVYRDLLFNYRDEPFTLVDLGTGSGVIAISIAKRFPNAKVYAVDIDYDALKVARFNARRHEVDVQFLIGDMLKPLIQQGVKVDYIISNPPYIGNLEEIEENVFKYEPLIALEAKEGTEFYEKIFADVNEVFDEQVKIYFEIGYDQRKKLTKFVEKLPFQTKFNFSRDLQGKDRYLFVSLKK